MANLFKNKIANKKIELEVGTVYAKPLPVSMMGWAQKLVGDSDNPAQQAVAFSMIAKAILVDENGNKLDDVEAMDPQELAGAFSVEDFTKLITEVMPKPQEGDDLGN